MARRSSVHAAQYSRRATSATSATTREPDRLITWSPVPGVELTLETTSLPRTVMMTGLEDRDWTTGAPPVDGPAIRSERSLFWSVLTAPGTGNDVRFAVLCMVVGLMFIGAVVAALGGVWS